MYHLLAALKELKAEQQNESTRDRAIAITHIETAILWLHKDRVDNLIEDSAEYKDY
jgi:hypothetical protein